MRGIVISPEYEKTKSGKTILKRSADPLKLRKYILYWDKIDFPKNINFFIGGSPEVNFLESAGVLKRTLINKSLNGDVGMFLNELQVEAFKKNNNSDVGSWSLAQPNSELFLPKDESIITSRNLEVELYRSIPVPTSEVSLDDIITFKEIRKDELLEFRELMDNFYLNLINSADLEREMNSCVSRVQRKIIEVDRVMNESKIRTSRDSLKIEFNINKILKNTLIGGIGGMQFGFPTLGSALGFASSVINIKSEVSLKPKEIPNDLKAYAYLYYADKELK